VIVLSHRRYALRLVAYLLEVRWKIYEESDLRETTRKYRVLNDGNTTVAVMRECRQERGKRQKNTKFSIVDARRDDGIFITTRFAPGIILGTFPRELSGLALLQACSDESLHRKWIRVSTARTSGIFSSFFSCYARRGLLMWKTWCENLRTKINYFRLLIHIRDTTKECVMYKKPQLEFTVLTTINS